MRKSIGLMVLVAMAVSTYGSPLKEDDVPADSTWVAHLDVERFAQSPLYQVVNQVVGQSSYGGQINDFEVKTGFNPQSDLYGLTFFGRSGKEDDVVCLVNGRFEVKWLLDQLQRRTSYAREQVDILTIHSWTERNSSGRPVQFWGHFIDNEKFVGSLSKGDMLTGARVARGMGASLLSRGNLVFPTDSGVPFFKAVILESALRTAPPEAAMLKACEEVFVSLEAQGEDIRARSRLTFADETVAQNIRDIVAGMVSALVLEQNKQIDLTDVAQAIQIRNEGRHVHLELLVTLEQMSQFLTVATLEKAVQRF